MKQSIKALRGRIEESDDISEPDREVLLTFSDKLTLNKSTYSDHRHEKLLRHGTIMAERKGGLADAIADRDAAESVVRWIHEEYDNEETNKDYRVALRILAKYVENNGEEVPDSVDWVSATTSSTYDPMPDPAKMLSWEEVQRAIEEARNTRDAAALALQFDSGLRGGEFKDLTVGNISDHKHGLQITVQGKQGKRTVSLVLSVPWVEKWLGEHPADGDPDAPLWCQLNTGKAMSEPSKRAMLRRPIERAELKKESTPTRFRKSSVSHFASKGISQAHLESRYGWVRGSRVASRYVAVFSEETDRAFAEAVGKEVEPSETDEIAPLECPSCGKETPRDKDLCVWCGQALEPGAAQKVEALEDLILDYMAESDDPDRRTALRGIMDDARNNPELLAELVAEMETDE